MDIYDEELLRFWQSLNNHNVKYIMVGGVAINFHGYSRSTDDIDLWLEDTLKNRKKLRAAFKQYGLGDLEPLLRIEFLPGWTYFHLNNGTRLDVMTEVKGMENYTFDECLSLASVAEIYDTRVPFLHINHLLQTKKAANRPKDQLDIIELEKIQQILKMRGEI